MELGPEAMGAMAQKWGEVFLHIECLRFERQWADLAEYVRWGDTREAEEHTLLKRLRNLVVNGRVGQFSSIYPREQLYRQLPVLLGLTAEQVKDWPEAVDRYLAIWSRVA